MAKDVKVTGEVYEAGVSVPAPREGGKVGDTRYALDVAVLEYTREENMRTATSDEGCGQASNRAAASRCKKLERIEKRREEYVSQERQHVEA